MAGSAAGTGSTHNFDQTSITGNPGNQQDTTTFLSNDVSTLYLQQTHPGGVGTTVHYDDATDSSFTSSSSPDIMTPASTSSMSPYNTPLAFPAQPAIPQTPGSETSDQDNESSSSDTGKTKVYRCNVKGCKSKNKVFKLACQLRYAPPPPSSFPEPSLSSPVLPLLPSPL
jgi:hypothetical protein